MTTPIHIPPSGQYRTLKKNATVQDVAGYMVDIVKACTDDSFVEMEAEIIRHTPGTDVLQQLANRAYDSMYFIPDRNNLQTIRTPRRSLMDQRANCVDYTVFIASIARNLGLPVTIRIVQLPGQKNFGHVFPIVDGVIIDVVPGQAQDGSEFMTRQHHYPPIGHTWDYLAKQDFFI